MTNIWIEEQALKGSKSWQGFRANINYDEALRIVRKHNREEREQGHLWRYRITRITLSETVKVVK